MYAFDAIDIHPPNKNAFFKVVFLSSFIDFEKVFRFPDTASKESTSLGMP